MNHPLPNTFVRSCQRMAGITLLLGLAQPAWAALIVNAGNGTVTDNTTGLVWEQCNYGRTGGRCTTGTALLGSWQQALDAAVAANAANYKGFSDWRLPNVKELESITKIDSYTAGQPVIDTTAFPNTPVTGDSYGAGVTWTSTSSAPDPSVAWFVSFGYGNTVAGFKTDANFVRLVRSGQPSASFDRFAPIITAALTPFDGGVSVAIDRDGRGYWQILAASSPAPTVAALLGSGNSFAMAANTVTKIDLPTLTNYTAYNLYFVARDASNNPQTTVSSIALNRLSAPVGGTIPLLPKAVGDAATLPPALNMGAGGGPAFATAMAGVLSDMVGMPLRWVGQNALGTVTLAGYNGGLMAFVPHSFQASDSRPNGVYAEGDGQLQVVFKGQSVVIAPALVHLEQLVALLPGAHAVVEDNGVITATSSGVTYVVQPSVAVLQDPPTGQAQLVEGSDGVVHFIDALGNNQALFPAFVEPATLRSILQGMDASATLLVQPDGTAQISFKGLRYTLVPDMTLGNVPSERAGQLAWQDSATRYRVVSIQTRGASQGFTVRP